MTYVYDHPEDARYKVHFLKINSEIRPMKRDLSVPGGMRLLDPQPFTCHAAVASTYGKYADRDDPIGGPRYDPEIRT